MIGTYFGLHSRKINRARTLTTLGKYPSSFGAMLNYVSDDLRASLTSKQLAAMIDALEKCSKESMAICERACIDEGGVWNAEKQRFVYLDQHNIGYDRASK